MAALARFYYVDELALDPRSAAKFLKAETRPRLTDLRAALARAASWERGPLEAAFGQVISAHGIELGALAQPVRVAVTGGNVSPPIYETLEVLGRERTLRRLDAAIASLPA
jgi:glutamyl-tRNA synthetase